MATFAVPAFVLALLCFLVLSIICGGTVAVLVYFRYFRSRAPAADVEAGPRSPPSAANSQESAASSGSFASCDIVAIPLSDSSFSIAYPDDDKYTRLPSRRIALARAQTKAKLERNWTTPDLDASCSTMADTCIQKDALTLSHKLLAPGGSSSASSTAKLALPHHAGSSVSTASTPTLVSNASSPTPSCATSRSEAKTPPGIVPTSVARRLECRPSPSMESLEDRSVDMDAVVFAEAAIILASESLPSSLSGLSDIIGCLSVQEPAMGKNGLATLGSTRGPPFSLAPHEVTVPLPKPETTSPHDSSKAEDAKTSLDVVSASNTVVAGVQTASNSRLGSDTETIGASGKKVAGKRYAALIDALSTSFSSSSLRSDTPSGDRNSTISTSASSASSAHDEVGLSSGLVPDLSYDASESDLDESSCCSDEDCKVRSKHVVDPSLRETEHSVVAI